MNKQWVQLTMEPVEVLEVELAIGFIPSQDHMQWCITATDASNGSVIAMVSEPHRSRASYPHTISRATSELEALIYELITPF